VRIEFLSPNAGTLDAELLDSALGLVMERPPSIDSMKQWSTFEMLLVYDWAMREHLAAAGNIIVRRPRPFLVGNG